MGRGEGSLPSPATLCTCVGKLRLTQRPPIPVGELLRLVQGLAQHLLHQKAQAPWPPSSIHSRGCHVHHLHLSKQSPEE